jgi:hypothetical protein
MIGFQSGNEVGADETVNAGEEKSHRFLIILFLVFRC